MGKGKIPVNLMTVTARFRPTSPQVHAFLLGGGGLFLSELVASKSLIYGPLNAGIISISQRLH